MPFGIRTFDIFGVLFVCYSAQCSDIGLFHILRRIAGIRTICVFFFSLGIYSMRISIILAFSVLYFVLYCAMSVCVCVFRFIPPISFSFSLVPHQVKHISQRINAADTDRHIHVHTHTRKKTLASSKPEEKHTSWKLLHFHQLRIAFVFSWRWMFSNTKHI